MTIHSLTIDLSRAVAVESGHAAASALVNASATRGVVASTKQGGRNNVNSLGRGDGTVLTFAHGFGCDQAVWRKLLPHFVDDYRLVLFDHVGAGHSDVNSYDWEKYGSLNGYASDVLEICAGFELEDVILVGHRVSTMTAVIAAVQDPNRFADLVLLAPSPRHRNYQSAGILTQADVARNHPEDRVGELVELISTRPRHCLSIYAEAAACWQRHRSTVRRQCPGPHR